jgi:hypothetical protein
MRKILSWSCLAVLVSCGGAPGDGVSGGVPEDASADLALARVVQELQHPNAEALNGRTLNGRTLNGTELGGLLVSVNYRDARLETGAPLTHLRAEAGQLAGRTRDGRRQGMDFIGAELVGNLGSGDALPLRIRDIVRGPGANADLLLYDVDYYDANAGAWRPACADADGARTLAVPLPGRWDYRSGVRGGGDYHNESGVFTFACASGAVGKCVLWGYRPWKRFNGESLASYHQACTRLVRADYCGKGTSYTQNGRVINVYDHLGIQQDTEGWVAEARWDEHGARCFRARNRSTAPVPCYRPEFERTCAEGAPRHKQELLVTELVP